MEGLEYKLINFLGPEDKFHIARVNISSPNDILLHYHNYAELLWVENGEALHIINGCKVKLSKGDMVMVRPNDRHTFHPIDKNFTIINIAFEPDILEIIENRYFQNTDLYFWATSHLPFMINVPDRILKRISSRAENAMKYSRNYLQLDSLLLYIFRHLSEEKKKVVNSSMPIWLINAIQAYNTPEMFEKGVNGFIGLCNRNTDYVNRVVKKHLNKTVTELVNEHKMRYASLQLEITSMPIKEICTNCGFRNLSHFYELFVKFYSQTPSQYRQQNQSYN